MMRDAKKKLEEDMLHEATSSSKFHQITMGDISASMVISRVPRYKIHGKLLKVTTPLPKCLPLLLPSLECFCLFFTCIQVRLYHQSLVGNFFAVVAQGVKAFLDGSLIKQTICPGISFSSQLFR